MTSKDRGDETIATSTDGNQPPVDRSESPADGSIDRLGGRSDADRFAAAPDRSATADASLIAFGFLGLGALGIVGGLVVPDGAGVLFALGGVGLFAGLLTYALTDERFVPANDAERIYAACAANLSRLVAASETASTGRPVYVPVTNEETTTVRLFVPSENGSLEDAEQNGVVLEPTGLAFVREIERSLPVVTVTPARIADRLADALVDRFELADDATVVDTEEHGVTVTVSDAAFGDVDRFDHPVVSTLAVGLAAVLQRPIAVETDGVSDGPGDWRITCQWEGIADAPLDRTAIEFDSENESVNA